MMDDHHTNDNQLSSLITLLRGTMRSTLLDSKCAEIRSPAADASPAASRILRCSALVRFSAALDAGVAASGGVAPPVTVNDPNDRQADLVEASRLDGFPVCAREGLLA
jgi:hypothetical protein